MSTPGIDDSPGLRDARCPEGGPAQRNSKPIKARRVSVKVSPERRWSQMWKRSVAELSEPPEDNEQLIQS